VVPANQASMTGLPKNSKIFNKIDSKLQKMYTPKKGNYLVKKN